MDDPLVQNLLLSDCSRQWKHVKMPVDTDNYDSFSQVDTRARPQTTHTAVSHGLFIIEHGLLNMTKFRRFKCWRTWNSSPSMDAAHTLISCVLYYLNWQVVSTRSQIIFTQASMAIGQHVHAFFLLDFCFFIDDRTNHTAFMNVLRSQTKAV